jgi:hypothetical protein
MHTIPTVRRADLAQAASRRRSAPRVAAAVAAGALLCALASGAAFAAMYKWVDDKGVVHYSDQIPPEAVNKGSTQINKEGYTVKKVDPANPEQVRAREQEAAQKRAAASREKADEEVERRRDRAVLDSYTTEADIDLAKSRSVKTLQAALQSAQSYSAQLTKRKSELLARKESFAGKPVPADVERELAANAAELGRQSALIKQKQAQLEEVVAKYDADKERWQALKGGTQSAAAPATATTPAAPAAAARKK